MPSGAAEFVLLAMASVPKSFDTLSRMPAEVIVYSRQGCHLCDVVIGSLERLAQHADFTWKVVDIDGEEALRARYDQEVPVVFINGRKAFKYHMNEDEFLRKLRS